jgi:TetR/AcrR family transcriptional regulator, transcriptional repressor for nem operon
MRYDSEHKQQTRNRVLDAAARAIRAAGPDRVGVAGVMADAGLTHGGFYAHFASKEDLVAATIEHMFAQVRERIAVETEGLGPAEGLAGYIRFYLSRKHRDARTSGCPVAALSSDLPRLSDAARVAFARGVNDLTNVIAGQLKALGHGDSEAEARSTVAELVGALSISRTQPDAKHADAILADSKRYLLQRLGLGAQT